MVITVACLACQMHFVIGTNCTGVWCFVFVLFWVLMFVCPLSCGVGGRKGEAVVLGHI